jgi:AraC family transcriptional regulator, arabinose operon regulatory protein
MRMREDIISFIKEELEEPPFFIEMTGISYCDETYRIARKSSNIYVFEYILEGEGTVLTDNKQFTPVKGDVYILHKQSNHEYYSDRINPWIKIWFNARGTLIDSLMQIYHLNKISHIEQLDVSSFFNRILSCAKELKNNRNEFQKEASLIFFEFVLFLHSNIEHHDSSSISAEAMLLKQYLDSNNGNNITIDELAKVIYRSPSHTIRIFNQAFGVTPYQYLMRQKTELAKLILLNTNKSIKEISMELNFGDEHYFSNYFKEKVGVSPLNFRKAHRQ